MTTEPKKPFSASDLFASIQAAKAKPATTTPEAGNVTEEDNAAAMRQRLEAEAYRKRSAAGRFISDTTKPVTEGIEEATKFYSKTRKWLSHKFDLAARVIETGKIAYRWANYLPLSWPITKPLEYGWRLGKWGFKRVGFELDENGERSVLSPKRTAAALLLSIPVAFGAYEGYKYYYSNLAGFAYDSVVINLNSKQGVFVFGAASEVEGQPDVYMAPACLSSTCEGQANTVQFRIRDSVYLDVIRFFTSMADGDLSNTDFGEFHDPSELAGSFLSGKSVCAVNYYGIRHKTFNWYPYITDVTCTDVEDGNIEQTIKDMKELHLPPDYEMPSPM